MADTSGSMSGRPLATALGLALYFAERNKGAYHNLFMSFSERPDIISVSGTTLVQKIRNMNMTHWDMNTNLYAAFKEILRIAIENNVPNEDMVKSLIVISDLEIDCCEYYSRISRKPSWSFYDDMAKEFAEHGYSIPNVVFWNVESRHNIFHADATRKGVQLCSGSSTTTFKQLMDSIGLTPVEMMEKVINSERYSLITINK